EAEQQRRFTEGDNLGFREAVARLAGLKDEASRLQEALRHLGDAAQTTARDFKAQCTPDLYLFDAGKKLVYHGRIDDNWQEESKVRRQELKEAIEALAAGKPVPGDQRPSMGCSIKWR
ncbi:MAG: hypothetical protein AAB339_01460, partial [Elusimicrobiota bacterium]